MDKNINGSFIKKKVYFSQVSNSALRDSSLSLKAKGLYAIIQSYITIEDFILYKATLKKMCVEGEKSFENTWKELKDAGYLIQYRHQKEKGHYYYEYELLDVANKEYADGIHSKQNRKLAAAKVHNPKKEGMVKNKENHNPKKDNMDNGYDGEVGVYSDTGFSNTDLINTENTTAELTVVSLIQDNTNLKLTTHQNKLVSNWSIETTTRAISIYNKLGGLYFKLLAKIYTEGAIESLVTPKVNKFNDMLEHGFDYANLEALEEEYISRKISGAL